MIRHKTRHKTRYRLLAGALAVAFLGGFAAQAQAPARYLAGLPEVPLAPGLSEMEEARLMFDKPEGRIVQLAAGRNGGAEERAAIAAFYAATLPNLGWQQTARQPLTFTREGEILRISIHADLVIFDVAPKTAQ